MKPVFEAMGIKDASASWDDPGGHHSTGTCRMAETTDEGVVDKNLRVFGTENLYVCSNAAFPTCAAVNPTLTLVAMSMRLADYLSPLPPHRLIAAAGEEQETPTVSIELGVLLQRLGTPSISTRPISRRQSSAPPPNGSRTRWSARLRSSSPPSRFTSVPCGPSRTRSRRRRLTAQHRAGGDAALVAGLQHAGGRRG